jgi:glycosyltransferase involved in cell wall biosynthesis
VRILFLCKRRYMSKDVILERYARLYEIPYQLARRGHEVLGLCLSYAGAAEGTWQHKASPGGLEWRSFDMGRTVLPGLIRFLRQADALSQSFKPDLVIGASDIPHCWLAQRLAARLGVPYALDLYDDFESYGQARLPGAKTLFRNAVRNAGLVSCVSQPLAERVRQQYRAKGRVIVLESTIDKTRFKPQDRRECRRQLGLPDSGRLIGTAGALSAEKGIGTLYRAFDLLADEQQDLHLVIAGPMERKFPPPRHPRVHYLGLVPHAQVATLFSALDVGVICVPDTPFGRFSFPQKAYEMIACGIPVMAAAVGAMGSTLGGFPDCLFLAENPSDLAAKLRRQLERPQVPQLIIMDWGELAGVLEGEILKVHMSRGK